MRSLVVIWIAATSTSARAEPAAPAPVDEAKRDEGPRSIDNDTSDGDPSEGRTTDTDAGDTDASEGRPIDDDADAPIEDEASVEVDDDASSCPAGACGRLRLRLRRAGDRSPIAGATILVFAAPAGSTPGERDDPEAIVDDPAWVLRGETDDLGDATIDAVPRGRVALEIIAPDFVRRRIVVDLAGGEARTIKSFIRATEAARYRTTVQSKRAEPRPAPFRRGLTTEEVRTLPGSQGDPLRALQSLPGFGRTPLGLGLLVLRGASPNQSQVFVSEHPVPRAFHLSGLAAILPGDAIARVDAVPGNFDSAYGNASGGIVILDPRVGRRDGYHGAGTLDIAGAAASAQGPLGKGTFAIGGRRSHLDLPLRLVADVNPQAPVIIPTYYDYHAFYDLPLRRRASLHLGLLGAGDRFAIRAPETFDEERSLLFDLHTSFHRIDAAYRKQLGATRLLLTPSLRYDRQRLDFDQASNSLREQAWVTSYRAELQHDLSSTTTFVLGTDGLVTADSTTRDVTTEDEGSEAMVERTETRELRSSLGLYAVFRLRFRRVDLDPGFRVAAFTADDREGDSQTLFAADPRLNGVVRVTDRWSLRGGVGLYSQPARPSQSVGYVGSADIDTGEGHVIIPSQILNYFDPTRFTTETGTVRVRRALQASAGVAHTRPSGLSVELVGFVRDQDNGFPIPNRTLYQSKTLAYGGEVLIRRDLKKRFYGWIAYTLLWVRTDLYDEADATPRRRVDDFDQRHNLVLAGSLRLVRGWRLGGRFRLVSGTPYTPIVGAIQRGDSFDAIRGETNSDRFPIFYQLDLRVDKEWILRRVVVSAYLDLLNATNAANTEAYVYSNDFRARVGGVAMPILPVLGLRIDG